MNKLLILIKDIVRKLEFVCMWRVFESSDDFTWEMISLL